MLFIIICFCIVRYSINTHFEMIKYLPYNQQASLYVFKLLYMNKITKIIAKCLHICNSRHSGFIEATFSKLHRVHNFSKVFEESYNFLGIEIALLGKSLMYRDFRFGCKVLESSLHRVCFFLSSLPQKKKKIKPFSLGLTKTISPFAPVFPEKKRHFSREVAICWSC